MRCGVSLASALQHVSRHYRRAREVAQRLHSRLLFVRRSLSKIRELNVVKSARLLDEMEVIDSPLNRAHRYSRKADQLVGKEKYEEAIVCHGEAAELLTEALSMTQSEQVRLSLELQRDRHLQQQRLIKMSCEQAELKGKLPAAKDDKTRLEEQSTAIADLWKLTAILLMENKRLLEEHDKLKAENAGLKRGSYEGHQSSSASPTQPLSLGMRLLHVTPDLQMLLETENDG